jgi:hypothetical protein
MVEVLSDMSGSDSDCYKFKYDPFLYNDIDEVDIDEVNKGFNLKPLCQEIYGRREAYKSKAKFMEKDLSRGPRTTKNGAEY